ncbi:MAG: hypothetical protein ACI90V_002740 [Bacillariaceae sp.]|jgi:hypothetical protein
MNTKSAWINDPAFDIQLRDDITHDLVDLLLVYSI